jgi:flagellar basal body-associated protein FliL
MRRTLLVLLGFTLVAALAWYGLWRPLKPQNTRPSTPALESGAPASTSHEAPRLPPPVTKSSPDPDIAPDPDAGVSGPGPMDGLPHRMDLGEHVVALNDPDGGYRLRVALSLKLTGNQATEQLEIRRPALERTLELLTGQRTPEEMKDPKGRERLRIQLLRRYRTVLHTIRVLELDFTRFDVLSPGAE